MRLGLIGYGAIGQALAQRLAAGPVPPAELVVLVRPDRRPQALPGLGCRVTDPAALIGCDLVVEAAGAEAVRDRVPPLLLAGVPCLLASVGALADPATEAALRAAASPQAQVLIPAGAIGGIDMAASLARDRLTRVTYEGRKPPAAWAGSPAEQVCALDAITVPTVLFEGTARAAARAFPKNANVAATLALATLGLDDTTVRLIADPKAVGNSHRFTASGPVADMTFEVRARPSAGNPRSSETVILSLLRAVENRRAAIVI